MTTISYWFEKEFFVISISTYVPDQYDNDEDQIKISKDEFIKWLGLESSVSNLGNTSALHTDTGRFNSSTEHQP